MSKYIVGGGLVGLLAKEILGAGWQIIPHGTSRYYSFTPAIADDAITVSEKTDLTLLGNLLTRPYTRAFSFGGQLIFGSLKWVYDVYTEKVYGTPQPGYDSMVPVEQLVSDVTARELYKKLLEKYMPELVPNTEKFGQVKSISNGAIHTTTGLILPYDQIVSTIPLDALYDALGMAHNLVSKDAWVYHVETDKLDFEGAEQVLVVDDHIPFYKVNQVGYSEFVFYCLAPILTPMPFFGAFCNNRLRIMNPSGTKHKSFIPIGGPRNLGDLHKLGIQCVGSHAEWDDCVDIGTCIIRLLKLRI